MDVPYLMVVVACLAGSAILMLSMGRRKAGWQVLPFLKRSAPRGLFLRWLTAEQTDALRRAGINYTPHTVRHERGIMLDGVSLKPALRALNSRVLARFPTGVEPVDEIVLSPNRPPDAALDRLTVSVSGVLGHNPLFFWRGYFARKRIGRVIRETFLPTIRQSIQVHLVSGRTYQPDEDGDFHICVWSSAQGSGRQTNPDRLWGVPLETRKQSLAPSRTGIPIVETASEFTVGELVGTNTLYIHLEALTKVSDTELALLSRILDALREEMNVGKFLEEIVSSLPEDGMPIGAANAGKFSIFDQGFDGRRQDVVKTLVKQILVPAVRKDVFVKQCQGYNQEPLEDGMFHVFFSSAPLGAPSVATPERLWSYRVLKPETVFLPSGRGAIIADNAGFQIAEVVGSNLYIFGDLLQYGCSKGSAILAKLLMEVRKELALAKLPDRTAHDDTVLVDECWRQVTTVGKGDANTDAKAKQAGNGLLNVIRAARTAEQECYRLECTPTEAIGSEFDELCKIKKVLDIAVSETSVVVTTDTLFCVDPRDGVRYEIGAFKIAIPTNKGAAIVWTNQTRRCAGHDRAQMNAPHVNAQGHACLGNTKDLFPELIGRREFASAVELAIAFIESVNTSDTWGKHISNWPVAKG